MKAKNKDEELVKVSYRLPKDLLKELEDEAIENRRSINDELIYTLKQVSVEWRRKRAVAALKETSAQLATLQADIEKYAASRSISFDQAMADLGEKACAEIELLNKGRPKKSPVPKPGK